MLASISGKAESDALLPLPFDSELIGWLADLADASAAAFWEVLACLRRTRGQGASADPNADASADVGERRNDSPSDGSSTGSSSLTSGQAVWTG
jgi:hypothetical protein